MKAHTTELRILGPTTIAADDGDWCGHPPPKRLALLAYLSLETADGFRRRDQIVGLLWPELPQEAARGQLRKSLSALRDQFGADTIVSRGEGEIQVNSSLIHCDAALLVSHARNSEWASALALYRGELLEGLFVEGTSEAWETWLDEKRRALRSMAARAAWECARLEEVSENFKGAAIMARRGLELTPDDEDGVRRLISLLDRAGDRAGALRFYGEWCARLQLEFGVEPAPETRKLARRVQAARHGESHETPPLGSSPIASARPHDAPHRTLPAGPRGSMSATRWTRRRIVVGSGVLAAASLLVVLVLPLIRAASAVAAPAPGTVAVLPLHAIGPEMDDAARGIGEDVTNALILTPGLMVFPAGRVGDVAECAGDPHCIGQRLNVAHVLDGGVQGSHEQLRITLRLVRTRDRAALWAGVYDVAAADRVAALQRLANDVASAIGSRLAVSEVRATGSKLAAQPGGQRRP